jgi:hypothetical protein
MMKMLRHVFTWEAPRVKLPKAKVTIFGGGVEKGLGMATKVRILLVKIDTISYTTRPKHQTP